MAHESHVPGVYWRLRGTFLEFYVKDEDYHGYHRGSAACRAVSLDSAYSLMKEHCQSTESNNVYRGSWPMGSTNGQQFEECSKLGSQCNGDNEPLLNIAKFIEQDPRAHVKTAMDLSRNELGMDSQNGTKQARAGRRKSKRIDLAGLTTGIEENTATTVMIRHIACRYMQEEAVAFLDEVGLKGKYDFVYLPLNPSRRANLGYMFVNFLKPEHVDECKQLLNGQPFGESKALKRCEVTLAHVQGYANIAKHFLRKTIMKGQHAPLFVQTNGD